jgi:hypothetical protein
VSVTDLVDGPPPPTLFPDARAEKRRALEAVVARMHDRFGASAITRAALLDDDGPPTPRPASRRTRP